eukprot:6768233-Prymnesium_polylepis.1
MHEHARYTRHATTRGARCKRTVHGAKSFWPMAYDAKKLRGSPKTHEWRSAGPRAAAPRAMPACPARPHAAPL